MNDSDPPRPKLRRYQFSLKTLMLLVTATAATLGLLATGGTFALTLVLPMAGAISGSALRTYPRTPAELSVDHAKEKCKKAR